MNPIRLTSSTRQKVVDGMVSMITRLCGAEFDFVLILRRKGEPSYILTDVKPDRARSMLREGIAHPDLP